MILVDKNIKAFASAGQLISDGYNEDHVNSISYDLTIDCIYADPDSSESTRSFELEPGCAVFIKTTEKLNIPKDIMGRIAEKNSRMRQGLKVDGPHYHPGHETYAFLRIQNISSKIILLKSKTAIAQIIFEKLSEVPDMTYDRQPGASFNNEVSYRGLGNYKEEYEKETVAKIDKAKEDLDSVSNRIYANVLTIMGVLVAVFSLITINHNILNVFLRRH